MRLVRQFKNQLLSKRIQHQLRRYSDEVNKPNLKYSVGPVSVTSLCLFVGTGAFLYYYLNNLQLQREEDKEKKLEAYRQSLEMTIGKPKIGGPFQLVDQDNKVFTEAKLNGKFSIIYFGFTHCPDICPDELDKITLVVDNLSSDEAINKIDYPIQPIFITCDPNRDNSSVIKEYLTDFHPKFLGLTGTVDQISKACKAYRVYYSKPPIIQTEDYLVDHSIFFYLMDPEGKFVKCFGKDKEADQVTKEIREEILKYSELNNKQKL